MDCDENVATYSEDLHASVSTKIHECLMDFCHVSCRIITQRVEKWEIIDTKRMS
jgi:hypothetical protein